MVKDNQSDKAQLDRIEEALVRVEKALKDFALPEPCINYKKKTKTVTPKIDR